MPFITIPIALLFNLCILVIVAPIGLLCKLILKGVQHE
jgi:hypothetical protein